LVEHAPFDVVQRTAGADRLDDEPLDRLGLFHNLPQGLVSKRSFCHVHGGGHAQTGSGTPAAGHHLGAQQGPSSRSETTAVHADVEPRRRRARVLSGRQRQDQFRQVGRGRPTQDTAYRRETTLRFDLRWTIDEPQWQLARRDDGVFPLLTNDRQLTPQEVLAAYKRQPPIEKRFAQLKSDYEIAPVTSGPVVVLAGASRRGSARRGHLYCLPPEASPRT